ncbi:hypothetical protein [Mucilaginibacter sp. JRF]|uniref:hypothetical protein n=1 Tax=Mucilaginibacter sp. JRF TaxID=2780088 RepID=UPI001D15E6BF|nr:hypothetical protein [Mucilaginibacter sp. JRF]
MRAIADNIKTDVLKEQFIPDHLFLYLIKGEVSFFDGNESYTYRAGECCIAQKNHLIKFMMNRRINEFEPIMFCFDEAFLRQFQKKHQSKSVNTVSEPAIIKVDHADLIDSLSDR